jgi:hypothetical protein
MKYPKVIDCFDKLGNILMKVRNELKQGGKSLC